jgi:hypothetical protein
MDQDWNITLIETISEIVKATDALEYHLAMRVFTAKINDSHAFFWSDTFNTTWRGNQPAPFLARFIESEIVITKVHSTISGLKPGDIIRKIDGLDIDLLRDSLRKYSWGSNEIAIEKNLIYLILLGKIGYFYLTILNETGERTLTLYRNYFYYPELWEDNTPYWREVYCNENRFGIIHMGNLYEEHIPQIIDKFHNVDAIIFDVRNYPNSTISTLIDYFFEGPLHISNLKWPDKDYPGSFFWHEAVIGQGVSNPLQKQTMILFDERTLSQAEYTCMGLGQIPGSIKIGSTTAGGDGDISYIRLPGSIEVMTSFLGIYYPDFTPTQRIGIIPDYYVYPTIQGIREGRDEVLEFALGCEFLRVNEVDKKEVIRVFPNPTTGKFRIEMSDEICDIEVFDVFGRKVQTEGRKEKSESEMVMNISHLPLGIYIVKIITNERIVTQKIIKN